VQNAEDLAKDRQLAARCFFVSLDHLILGKTISDRSALWPCRQKPKNWKSSPQLGEGNYDVFVKLLGLSDAEYKSLLTRGVIG
jgi:hypothetical protein